MYLGGDPARSVGTPLYRKRWAEVPRVIEYMYINVSSFFHYSLLFHMIRLGRWVFVEQCKVRIISWRYRRHTQLFSPARSVSLSPCMHGWMDLSILPNCRTEHQAYTNRQPETTCASSHRQSYRSVSIHGEQNTPCACGMHTQTHSRAGTPPTPINLPAHCTGEKTCPAAATDRRSHISAACAWYLHHPEARAC